MLKKRYSSFLLASAVLAPVLLTSTPAQAGILYDSDPMEAPLQCPSAASAIAIKQRYVQVYGNVRTLCLQAAAGAPTPQAASAIRYAFARLGAGYSNSRRNSVKPLLYDCSSYVGRAYNAGGAVIYNTKTRTKTRFYATFGFTGSYTPSNYAYTNLVRVTKAQLRPGDIIIGFNGSLPVGGNAEHARMYIGNGNVIQEHNPSEVTPYYQYYTHEWYFRYTQPKG